MKQNKKGAPKLVYPKQGVAENRYISGGNIWAASTLISYCKEKQYPIFKMPLAGVDLRNLPWDIDSLDDFIWHSKRIEEVGNHPIILDDYGRVCDGYHRVCKAIINNKTEIDAIRIEKMPSPDGHEERS